MKKNQADSIAGREGALRERVYVVIFGTDTPAGKRFDMVLIYLILLSVLALMVDSVEGLSAGWGRYLFITEWVFSIIFTLEYAVRIYCSPKPLKYITSFYGVVDLISVLPSYLSLIFPGANYLLVLRLLRVLRVFRILKLVRYLSEANILLRAMFMSRRKILVFFVCVLVLSTIFGSLMYVVEGPAHGFSSIPKSIYWTIVTITTVGYGDITPQTVLGQVIAAAAMLTGYSILAVPTGIFTAELAQEMLRARTAARCKSCERGGHDSDADYCRHCGSALDG
ncbi:voltage-gated potassium channel [Alteromonadaceae bacterium Bs31]|nr:voltage-gated potassium channel [Alteromonadaceae bacterium Bs31]